MTVLLLAFASATCSALSSVVKHLSADRLSDSSDTHGMLTRARAVAASMVASPLWLGGLAFDAAGVSLQVVALHFGDLSVVQPMLTVSLAISLAASHIVRRTRMPKREVAWTLVLVVGLLVFLTASDSMGPHGEAAVGSRGEAMVLGGLAALVVAVSMALGALSRAAWKATFYAVAVAVLYALTAALIKSCTRIFSLRGFTELMLSWQFWLLITAGALAMVLAQLAFAAGPLSRSLPVVASLDPLFSVVAGVVVYGERLSSDPLRLIFEGLGLAMLLAGVAGLGKISAVLEIEERRARV